MPRIQTMKRFIIDTLGNYVFFVPIVIAFTPLLQSWEGVQAYLIAAVPISLAGARAYTFFLKRFWYPLWGEKF